MAKKSVAGREKIRNDAVGVPIYTPAQSDMNMTKATLLWPLLHFSLAVLANLISMSICANFNRKPH